jgi:lipopolysaccharide export LptBFGC system permease protein LptF
MVDHRRSTGSSGGDTLKTTLWRRTALAVNSGLAVCVLVVFEFDPAFRGRMIFSMLLAAAVVSGLGWLLTSQRAKAADQAEAVIRNAADRRRGYGVADS